MRTRSLGAAALLPTVALAVVGLFAFQSARVLAASIAIALVELRDVSGVVGAAIVVVVAAGFLASIGVVSSATRPVVLAAVGLVVGLRLLLQLVTAPLAALAISGACVVASMVVVAMMAVAFGGRVTGTGLLLGAAADIAIMAGRRTLDLTRSTSGFAVAAVFALALVAVGAVWLEQQTSGPRRYGLPVPAAALFAVGPWFGIHLVATGNLGVISTTAGAPLALAAGAAALGALGALGWTAPRRASSVPVLAALISTAGLVLLVGADGGWALLLIVVVATALGAALSGALERESTAPPDRLGWAAAAGAALAIALVGVGESGLTLPFGASEWTMAGLGLAVLGGAAVSNTHRSASSEPWVVPAIAAAALIAVPLWLWATQPEIVIEPAADPLAGPGDAPAGREVLVATFNLNNGFDAQGRLALDSIVAALDETAWEIAALQELTRGRLRTGGLDLVSWLEHRLGVELTWFPSGSALAGNALMSRFPIEDAVPLTLALGDSEPVTAVDARVPLPDSELTLRVIGVGLDPQQAASGAEMLIDGWQEERETVVLGNFGGGPESDAVQTILSAGFYEIGRLVEGSAATYPAQAPTEQSDLVLISQDLSVSAIRVPESIASDHRPVVVRVLVSPLDE